MFFSGGTVAVKRSAWASPLLSIAEKMIGPNAQRGLGGAGIVAFEAGVDQGAALRGFDKGELNVLLR